MDPLTLLVFLMGPMIMGVIILTALYCASIIDSDEYLSVLMFFVGVITCIIFKG